MREACGDALRCRTVFLAVCGCSGEPAKTDNPQVAQRAQMAAYTMTDAVVVDCQMPGRLQHWAGGAAIWLRAR